MFSPKKPYNSAARHPVFLVHEVWSLDGKCSTYEVSIQLRGDGKRGTVTRICKMQMSCRGCVCVLAVLAVLEVLCNGPLPPCWCDRQTCPTTGWQHEIQFPRKCEVAMWSSLPFLCKLSEFLSKLRLSNMRGKTKGKWWGYASHVPSMYKATVVTQQMGSWQG